MNPENLSSYDCEKIAGNGAIAPLDQDMLDLVIQEVLFLISEKGKADLKLVGARIGNRGILKRQKMKELGGIMKFVCSYPNVFYLSEDCSIYLREGVQPQPTMKQQPSQPALIKKKIDSQNHEFTHMANNQSACTFGDARANGDDQFCGEEATEGAVPFVVNTTLKQQLSLRSMHHGHCQWIDSAAQLSQEEKVAALQQLFWRPQRPLQKTQEGIALFSMHSLADYPDFGTLGSSSGATQGLLYSSSMQLQNQDEPVFLNTCDPFCLVAVGVQGSGKSHTMGVVLENCLLHCPPVTGCIQPMTALVFHYDPDSANFCEAVTAVLPSLSLPPGVSEWIPTVQKLFVLVSPSFYFQRLQYYKDFPNCCVFPLLFRWNELDASMLRSLMCITNSDEQPLYMSVVLEILRQFQRSGSKPSFNEFKRKTLQQKFQPLQLAPLQQRLKLVESLILENEENRDLPFIDFKECFFPGSLVVCDLTDPMLGPAEANGIFQVMLQHFRNTTTTCAKLAMFDEAHKFLSAEAGDLQRTIVDNIRQMRHIGMRLAISTQNPCVLPGELLELVSVTVLHRFHSRDWLDFLSSKIPCSNEMFNDIMNLEVGEAFVFSTKNDISFSKNHVNRLRIRPRLTADGGMSVLNFHTSPS